MTISLTIALSCYADVLDKRRAIGTHASTLDNRSQTRIFALLLIVDVFVVMSVPDRRW
ncbi:hypothetical protein PQY67_12380 [Pseudomonadales bacterium]|nr:hypothetical protein [Pseudomonadales bacterium]